jgi:FkbM family methyltransferase
LVRNVALNGLRNVIALNAALGAKDGEARLYHVGEAPNSYSLGGERLDDERSNFEVVRVMTLDRAITDRGVSRVDVLKLDVEGAEELVLDGATEVLRRFRPVVLFEVGDEGAGRLGLTREGAWNVLKAQDYLLAVADPEGRLTEVEAPRDGNNVALPSERGGGTIRRR